MAASYPSSLPVKDAAGANLSTNPHSTLHDDMYDEIVAIATELGTLPKGTAATVKARLDSMAGPPSAWTAPTLLNSWANYGGGYQTPEYRKIGDIVYLRGIIGGGTLSSQAFTLPTGHRPPLQVQFGKIGSSTISYIEITTAGAVTCFGGTNTLAIIDYQFSTI